MICELCLETNSDDCIEIRGDEGQQLHIAEILQKHFYCCFDEIPENGYVCRKCWLKVDMFHEFYVRIEEIHNTTHKTEDIFVETFNEYVKSQAESVAKEEEKPQVELIKNNLNPSLFLDDQSHEKNDIDYDNETFENGDGDDDYFFDSCETLSNTPIDDKKKIQIVCKKEKVEKTVKRTMVPRRPSKKKIPKESQTFQCSTCQLLFLTDYRLQSHIKTTHLLLPFKCPEHKCMDSFMTEDELNQHKVDAHTRTECPHCNKMIIVSYLATHIRLRHEQDKRVVCDLCGRISNNKHAHRYHYQLEHAVQQKLQCDICGEWLKHKDTLRMHMSVRHIQGPQTCQVCGRISPNRKALAKHKKIHLADTKERFKCIVCGKGFRDNTKLKEHSYIHSGITDAYRCNYCDKTFRFGSSMYAHRKKAHPVEEHYRVNMNF